MCEIKNFGEPHPEWVVWSNDKLECFEGKDAPITDATKPVEVKPDEVKPVTPTAPATVIVVAPEKVQTVSNSSMIRSLISFVILILIILFIYKYRGNIMDVVMKLKDKIVKPK